ncbi:eyes absent homolog 3-like isoform X1 [Clytia hemisphaerica]|uniref:Eyes absent homolog n=1 Tax=Clytia hemisphaerica TaxID=252671 RepID=A0A7M5V5V4_9CNID
MTMTEVISERSSSVPGESEDDELLTPREKKPKIEKDLDDVFLENKKPTPEDLSPQRAQYGYQGSTARQTPERTYSTNSSNGSEIAKQEIPSSNLPNIFNVSCSASTMPSIVNTPTTGQSSYPSTMDTLIDYNSLTKQYHSASNLLQNITKTPYFDSSTGKYTENNVANNTSNSPPAGGKYFDNKYNFTGSQSEFNGRSSVTSSNYSFGPSNMLQSGFPPPQSIISKSLTQFAGSGYLPPTTSYPSLGSNPASFNAPYFNQKFASTDNNNYLYPNLFSSSTKLPAYSTSQGSTQIFPPPFGNNGLFPSSGMNSPLLPGSNNVPESPTNGSSYNQNPIVGNNSAGSQAPTTASPFSPTIPLMGNSTHNNQLNSSSSSNFETRMNFPSDSSYNSYLEMEHGTPINYNSPTEKYSTRSNRKSKLQNGVKKASKSKKSLQSDPEHSYDRVFIWDLDETILVFHSLITGEFASKFGKDPSTASTIGFRLEEMIYHIASSHLFFSDLEECDQVHVDDISTDDTGQDLNDYNFESDGFCNSSSSSVLQFPVAGRRGVDWNRKLAFRYRRIKEMYNAYRNNIDDLLGPGKREQWLPLRMEMENLSDSWHTLASKCIYTIKKRASCLNVLVTSSHLIPTLAKCMLFGLTDYFPAENIYSANKDGKEACFQRVQSRFGRKCTYVVVGNGRAEEIPSKQLGIPFWRVTNHGDLVNLHHALELGHL